VYAKPKSRSDLSVRSHVHAIRSWFLFCDTGTDHVFRNVIPRGKKRVTDMHRTGVIERCHFQGLQAKRCSSSSTAEHFRTAMILDYLMRIRFPNGSQLSHAMQAVDSLHFPCAQDSRRNFPKSGA